MLRNAVVTVGVTAVLTSGAVARAQIPPPQGRDQQNAQDLKRLSIEELSEINVTSVSRRAERLSDAAAAVSVVTYDDVRRSGVTTLADAMRLADGVDVALQNPTTWAVTARGFNISTANKLLVMIDGRSVYSPLFSGTFWEVQDQVLDDVDRIEVVRGPGGSTWGANAMNGVINVISRSSAETRGAYLLVTSGSTEHAIVSARYGARLGQWGNYRVFGKFRQRESGVLADSGADDGNDFMLGHAGFRIDSDETQPGRWMIQGDAYRGDVGLFARPDGDLAGGNVMARWTRRFSSSSEFRAQAYYDRTWRRVPLQFEELRDTVDVDVQQRMLIRGRHDVVAGAGFRVSHADDRGVAGFFFDPAERTNELYSFFVQDEMALPNRVFLIAGSKFERNDYTGFEVQPTLRARWSRTGRETLWGAISRAVRLPTRFDTDLRIVNPITQGVLLTGTDDFKSESVVAFEGGYRVRPLAKLAIDVAAFANRYDDLRSQELPIRPGAPITLENMLNATTSGVEIGATFLPLESWRVHGSYSFIHEDFTLDPASTDVTGGSSEANDATHLFSIRSFADLPRGFELDGVLRALSSRPQPAVPGYAELDLRVGYRVRPNWELSLVGQNLLHDRHAELFTAGSPRYEFRRGFYVRSMFRF
jgi:iron complex outermembrane recepter protein